MEHFFGILNLDQWFRMRYLLKILHIYISGGPSVMHRMICTILVEDIMKDIYVILF